jgi:hypothetical protein
MRQNVVVIVKQEGDGGRGQLLPSIQWRAGSQNNVDAAKLTFG